MYPGLPDGSFENQKIQFWVNFGGPWNGNAGIVCMEYHKAI
jgi:hypothetical protein